MSDRTILSRRIQKFFIRQAVQNQLLNIACREKIFPLQCLPKIAPRHNEMALKFPCKLPDTGIHFCRLLYFINYHNGILVIRKATVIESKCIMQRMFPARLARLPLSHLTQAPKEVLTGCLEHIHIKIILVIFRCEFIQNIGLSHLSGSFQLQHKSRIPFFPVNQLFINIPLQIHCSASCSVCSHYSRSCKFPQQLHSLFLRKEVLRY